MSRQRPIEEEFPVDDPDFTRTTRPGGGTRVVSKTDDRVRVEEATDLDSPRPCVITFTSSLADGPGVLLTAATWEEARRLANAVRERAPVEGGRP